MSSIDFCGTRDPGLEWHVTGACLSSLGVYEKRRLCRLPCPWESRTRVRGGVSEPLVSLELRLLGTDKSPAVGEVRLEGRQLELALEMKLDVTPLPRVRRLGRPGVSGSRVPGDPQSSL